MPIVTFDKVLKIILTILNILSAALRAFDLDLHSDPEELDSSGVS